MMAKRRSFADRIREMGAANPNHQALDQARALAEKVNHPRPAVIPIKKDPAAQQSGQQSGQHSGQQSGGQSDTLVSSLADTLADSLTVWSADSLADTPVSSLPDSLVSTPVDSLPMILPPSQRQVLAFLAGIPSGVSRLKDVIRETGIPYGTVRYAIKRLVEQELLTPIKKYRRGNYQGFRFQVLNAGSLVSSLVDTPVDSLVSGHSGQHSGQQSALISSSSLSKKTTTKSDFEQRYQDDPEVGWWRDVRKLPARKAMGWMQETGMDADAMIESLRHGRAALATNAEIRNPEAYFYKRIKADGYFQPPTDYESWEDASRRRALERVQRLEAVVAETAAAEARAALLEVLADRESARYQQALARIPARLRRKTAGPVFEAAMAKAIEDLVSDEDVQEGDHAKTDPA